MSDDLHVFVSRNIPEAGLDVLRTAGADFEIGQHDEEKGCDRAALLAGTRAATVLLPLLTEKVDAEVLEANPALLGVANLAVGYNNVDVDAASELGIPVSNTPGVLTDTSADLAWALLMAVARRIPEAHNYMAGGRYQIWGPNSFIGGDISPGGTGERKVLGIVGYGRIGAGVARRAQGFDMEVLAHSRSRDRVDADPLVTWADLAELLERSDFVTLHPPLTTETTHLIGADELAAMKPTAYLINTSRGPVVDEVALVAALKQRSIAGAALDVYEDEPAMKPGLAELDNVVIVPHIASASQDTRAAMAAKAATNAVAHGRRERAPDAVNPQVYDTDAYRARTARPLNPT